MKILKKSILLVIILAIVGLSFILNRPKPIRIPKLFEPNEVGTLMDIPDYIDLDTNLLGYQKVSENNFLQLFMNPMTTHFAVRDKRNHEVWYSNFIAPDASATRTYRNMQRSTFTLTYKLTDNTTRLWTNFEFSIQDRQFTIDFDAVENGFRVDYTIKDNNPKGFWFPTKISRDRYIELVLNPFNAHDFRSEAERIELTNFLRNAYVQMDDDIDTYILALVRPDQTSNDLTGIDISYLFEIMYEIGFYGNVKDEFGEYTEAYHLDDVAFDNEMYEYYVELTDPEFKVPMIVKLNEDHLHTEILMDEVESRDPFEIVSVRMLPYLGATRTTDEGYMVIPEGSGGLMYLNNGRHRQRSYTTHIYDRDTLTIPNRLDMVDIGSRMPIYGTKKEDTAILAIISQGAEHATITAEVSGKNDMYNKIFPEFSFFAQGLYYLTQSGIPIWHPEGFQYNPAIKFYIFNDDQADYSHMAQLYGKYIKSVFDLPQLLEFQRKLYLDILGSYDFDDYFLFFPYKNVGSLTTYRQALQIIQTLESYGIDDMVINYIGWFNKGIQHERPNKINLDSALGRKKDFNAYNQYLQQKGYQGYFEVDFMRLYDNPLFYSNNNISRIVGGTLAEFYPYDIASRLPDKNHDPYYLLKVNSIYEHVQSFLKDFNKLSATGVSLRYFGQQIYSDFHRNNGTYRYELLPYYQDILQGIKNNQSILMDQSNAYAIGFANHMKDVSYETSRYLMVDDAIPFYQIAIADKINYSMPSINIDQVFELDYYLLKAIETGSNLKFTVSYENSSLLIDTKYNTYFSTHFQKHYEDIVRISLAYQQLPIANSYLVKHQYIDPNNILVTYSNGITCTIDYHHITFTC